MSREAWIEELIGHLPADNSHGLGRMKRKFKGESEKALFRPLGYLAGVSLVAVCFGFALKFLPPLFGGSSVPFWAIVGPTVGVFFLGVLAYWNRLGVWSGYPLELLEIERDGENIFVVIESRGGIRGVTYGTPFFVPYNHQCRDFDFWEKLYSKYSYDFVVEKQLDNGRISVRGEVAAERDADLMQDLNKISELRDHVFNLKSNLNQKMDALLKEELEDLFQELPDISPNDEVLEIIGEDLQIADGPFKIDPESLKVTIVPFIPKNTQEN